MKFLNYTFEQSQSLVTKETVDKLNQKGSWKRFIGLFITSIVIYFFSIITPMFIKGLDSVASHSLVCNHVFALSFLFDKAQKKSDETKILHLLLHGSLTRYLYSMCWYNDDDTTKYCQYTIGGYVYSFHLLLDSNGSP